MLLALLNLIGLVTGAGEIGDSPKVELLFTGDAMQHQAQLDKALEIGQTNYDFSECYEMISDDIQEADYAICNLEVPLGGPGSYSGYPCFSAPDSFLEALIDAGFDMFLTANNHCLDRGDKAARRTLNVLDSLKVDHIGTFQDSVQRDSIAPFIKDINGFKIAFLNYTYGTNGIEPKEGFEVALIEKEKIRKEIEKAKSLSAEIIVVTIHWGIEYVLTENAVQRELAQFIADSGADIIIGSHPHVVQPMKIISSKDNKPVLVVYSLGNFISNMKTADTRGGAMVWVTITRDKTGKAQFDHADYDILFSAKPDDTHNYRIFPSHKEDLIPKWQKQHWEIFKRGALNIFNSHNEGVERHTYRYDKKNDTSK